MYIDIQQRGFFRRLAKIEDVNMMNIKETVCVCKVTFECESNCIPNELNYKARQGRK